MADIPVDPSFPRLRGGELVRTPRVLAIMTAFNEGDVIHHAIGALVAEGVEVYLIDNCSTDDTVEQASAWLGRGLRHVERYPDDAGGSERTRSEYVWRELLTRVEQVAAEQDADWYVFVNADEFRESPWPDLTLAEAIGFADSLGYSAINFELFDFQPVDDGFEPGTDVREHMRMYEPDAAHYNVLQIKGWRAQEGPVQVARSGGHDISFPGRRLFPVNFILRHYGLRGETHGRRKVFQERMPRFAAEERAGGWHVQYDSYVSGETQFLRDPATLAAWDANEARAKVLSRASRDLLLAQAIHGSSPQDAPLITAEVVSWATRATGSPVSGRIETALQTLGGSLGPVSLQPGDAPLWLAAARILSLEHTLQGGLVEAQAFRRAAEQIAAGRQERQPDDLEVRAFTTVALADEVVADPALLAAYGAVFGPGDDATLVIYAPDADAAELGERLGAALAEASLEGDDSPDMLALAGPSALLAIERVAGAVLSSTADALPQLPRFEASGLEALRALAEQRWAA
jgi:glycosyltransferase involved in cell wall biosynthesis